MTTINPGIFREYDIRGIADTDLTTEALQFLAKGLAAYFQSKEIRHVLVGRDCRTHSPRISQTMIELFLAFGFDVTDVGMCTSPLFYYAGKKLAIDGGIMITASHNPPQDNGMKVACGPSTIYGEEIQKVCQLAQQAEAGSLEEIVSAQPGHLTSVDLAAVYINELTQRIRLGQRKLHVVVDCGNGSSGAVSQAFMQNYSNLSFTPLFFEPDGTFPNHEPDPTKAKNLQFLRERVLAEQADLGIAFDGDGDRLGVVDQFGNVLYGDTLMAIYWREILAKHPGALCLVEVKCSQSLVDEINRLGGQPEFCRTGHSLIKARMRETKALFTGEMSGHLFFADEYYGFDDALYAAGRLLRILSHSEATLSEMVAVIPKYYSTAETRIACADDLKFRLVEQLKERLSQEYPVITVDGVRVIFPQGWGLFRASNTQPAIVSRCEAQSEAELAAYLAILNEVYQTLCPGENIDWVF